MSDTFLIESLPKSAADCSLWCSSLEKKGDAKHDIPLELKGAVYTVEQGCPLLFITGRAGTGKSTLIKLLKQASFYAGKNLVVLAPTGVAALNVYGQTIHSFFHLPPHLIDPNSFKPKLIDEVKAVDILVIDEVSMVRPDILDAVDLALQKNKKNYHQPFAGVQVVVVGDLFQLPPVVAGREEYEFISDMWGSPYFFAAHSVRSNRLFVYELTEVYRQQDEEFIKLLDTIREGEYLDDALELINSKCYKPDKIEEVKGETITITTTRAAAKKINTSQLKKLKGVEREYQGVITGDFDLRKEKLPAPYSLVLKKGALVMFTKNDERKRWVNGTLGIVESLRDNCIRVRAVSDLSKSFNVVWNVTPVIWESYKYKWDEKKKKLIAEVSGTYKQYPLTPAWAITIHKSQGVTLDRVIIDFGSGSFAPGQAYTALSRCKSLSGIFLKRPLKLKDIKQDPVVKEFYRKIRGKSLRNKFVKMRL
ncbi:MAG: hypothetical protein D6780_00855 [Candidatus Dadabacteria bacterium]|nr:MAG: hypothetical protein D6780_00855 [Candidatus Dadabacteria bacterium]